MTETFGRKRNVALRLTTILEIAHESKEKKMKFLQAKSNTYPGTPSVVWFTYKNEDYNRFAIIFCFIAQRKSDIE